eukprot:COSAG05_NODE_7646_length_785_cov_0.969388_1_plen_115_part_01
MGRGDLRGSPTGLDATGDDTASKVRIARERDSGCIVRREVPVDVATEAHVPVTVTRGSSKHFTAVDYHDVATEGERRASIWARLGRARVNPCVGPIQRADTDVDAVEHVVLHRVV